jgi:hypothetical protein
VPSGKHPTTVHAVNYYNYYLNRLCGGIGKLIMPYGAVAYHA